MASTTTEYHVKILAHKASIGMLPASWAGLTIDHTYVTVKNDVEDSEEEWMNIVNIIDNDEDNPDAGVVTDRCQTPVLDTIIIMYSVMNIRINIRFPVYTIHKAFNR